MLCFSSFGMETDVPSYSIKLVPTNKKVAFAPDCSKYITESNEGILHLIDKNEKSTIKLPRTDRDRIFFLDNKNVIFHSFLKNYILNTETLTMEDLPNFAYRDIIKWDEQSLLYYDVYKERLEFYDVKSGKTSCALNIDWSKFKDIPDRLAVHAQTYIAANDNTSKIGIWNYNNPENVIYLEQLVKKSSIADLTFSPDGKLLIAASSVPWKIYLLRWQENQLNAIIDCNRSSDYVIKYIFFDHKGTSLMINGFEKSTAMKIKFSCWKDSSKEKQAQQKDN